TSDALSTSFCWASASVANAAAAARVSASIVERMSVLPILSAAVVRPIAVVLVIISYDNFNGETSASTLRPRPARGPAAARLAQPRPCAGRAAELRDPQRAPRARRPAADRAGPDRDHRGEPHGGARGDRRTPRRGAGRHAAGRRRLRGRGLA